MFPALRSAKISPGIASKIASKGARESAQPMIAQCGACSSSARALRTPLPQAEWSEAERPEGTQK